VEAALGPINVVECAASPQRCSRSRDCDCRSLYRLLNHQLAATLGGFTLADLASGRLREAVERELGAEPLPAGREK
jgi:DNA-binding IscR family transcriptional regulator